MDFSLLYAAGGMLAGLLLGLLIASHRYQKRLADHQAALGLHEQSLASARQELERVEAAHRQSGQQLRDGERELRDLYSRLAAAEERLQPLEHWRKECEQLNGELRALREVNSAQEAELREVTIRLEETRIGAEEKQRLLMNSEQRLASQFENLANRIFEQSGRKVDEQNRQSLDLLLTPLREQLDGFRRQVQDSFGQEARERHTLTHEIRSLQQLNTQMAREAVNLTKALKGDNKTQGNWGEVVLSRVLEASGLREGYEYQTQVNIQIDNAHRMQPDVIVRLPQGKDVIIDAKMSLVAYERFFNSQDESERQLALTEHIQSLRGHMRLLGRKDYQQLPGLRSLDYVLMFIPVEPAFMLAIDKQPELIGEAQKQNIMLVSPTTLLVALRTISNLWRYEHQSRNAQHIAERAARLYDKMRLFVDDMLAIGQSLDKAQGGYRSAMNKLTQGRGNILSQAEGFRALGVEIKRPINSVLAEQAEQGYNDADISDARTADDDRDGQDETPLTIPNNCPPSVDDNAVRGETPEQA
ncbi:DNA recombination protein RmuC [Sodalis ligni]|uniref:DNA recombination protein RmuC n=1 Tax=Sodalis ligni TaxID=2697027 RepID=A0A4R1NC87_9GAMM|nr:DNA recombination protein RmuC [Sodalis ligni]TCL05134.1 DNA recombination protein RmuC [Sodalis ligni]